MFLANKIQEAADYLHRRGVKGASRAVALEPGMGGFTNELSRLIAVPFKKIPYFPFPQTFERRGILLLGSLEGKLVIVLEGRGMLSEGYFHRELAFPLRVLASLGLERLLLAASAFSLGKDLRSFDVVAVEDHIDLSGGSPLRGLSPPASPGSMDLAAIHSQAILELARDVAGEQGIAFGRAVAAYLPGPVCPTAAEEKMLGAFGADMACFSLAAETMIAPYLGIETASFGIPSETVPGTGTSPGTRSSWNTRTLAFFKELLSRL